MTKRKIIRGFIIVIALFFSAIVNVYSQGSPQGFNYQTTVRNSLGVIYANQTVNFRFAFYSGSSSGILQWQETQLVATDSNGAVKIIIGLGTSTGAGLQGSFSQINWSSNSYFMAVAIDLAGGTNFIDMGNSQLFSVPYAFYSLSTSTVNTYSLGQFNDVDLTGIAPHKLLKYNGTHWAPAIDNHHDTVMLAYNGQHSHTADTAHYSDTATYALTYNSWLKTGNAIGTSSKYLGTNDAKDIVFKTHNSKRMILKTNGDLFIGNPTDSARLSILGNDGLVEIGTYGVGDSTNYGIGTRMVWYSSKASMRAGSVDISSIGVGLGEYSFATGYNTKVGNYSFASGYACVAGDNNLAMGRKCQSTALGNYPSGSGLAIGDSCLSSQERAVAIGRGNSSTSYVSISIGKNNLSSNSFSYALGTSCIASGISSYALGYKASTNGANGSFVYSDASSNAITYSTAINQFMVGAAGGSVFYSDSMRTMGVRLPAGGGSWMTVCDRKKKTNFEKVDYEEILTKIGSLKIKSWNYKSQSKRIRHIGPMAQDFYTLFKVGENNTSITEVDINGVALAGIKGLNNRILNLQVLENLDSFKDKIEELNTSELNRRLDLIEATINK